MSQQTTDYLESNVLLSDSQYGFRRGRCCCGAGDCGVRGGFTCAHGNAVAIFCDLSKAFHTINHQRLLSQKQRLGISDGALRLTSSYLQGRSQVYFSEDNSSSWADLTCGVPQESVFGPLLFLIYVNDVMVLEIPARIVSFADNTAILLKRKAVQKLYADATFSTTAVARWMGINGLVLNLIKTKFMLFGRNAHGMIERRGLCSHEAGCMVSACGYPHLERVDQHKYL